MYKNNKMNLIESEANEDMATVKDSMNGKDEEAVPFCQIIEMINLQLGSYETERLFEKQDKKQKMSFS